jgi:hypothetical protein
VGNDLVLVPMKNNVAEMNEMFTLNEVGGFIWESLDDSSTKDSLSASIATEFDVEESIARDDLNQFLNQIENMMNG